jgi:hypothetical protein
MRSVALATASAVSASFRLDLVSPLCGIPDALILQRCALGEHLEHAPLRLAGEHRADAHLLDAGGLHLVGLLLGDLLVDVDDDLAAEGVLDVLQAHPADDAVAQRLDHLARLDEWDRVTWLPPPVVRGAPQERSGAFSCRGRSFCPSCEKKKQLLWAEWLRKQVLAPVAHRHVVLTIRACCVPCSAAAASCSRSWLAREALQQLVRLTCGSHARPGIVVSVATAGDLLQWHPAARRDGRPLDRPQVRPGSQAVTYCIPI